MALEKGDSIVVVKSRWNDSDTRKLIGKKGTMLHMNAFLFCELVIDKRKYTLHFEEIERSA